MQRWHRCLARQSCPPEISSAIALKLIGISTRVVPFPRWLPPWRALKHPAGPWLTGKLMGGGHQLSDTTEPSIE